MADLEKVIKGLECFTNVYPSTTWGECKKRNCSYLGKDCELAVMADALELLKAQEPRVMTSEEVQRAEEGTVVWFEQHTPEQDYLQPMVSTGDGCVGNNYLGVNLQYVKDGAKEYRFWTSRPTEEQRKAAKWDG